MGLDALIEKRAINKSLRNINKGKDDFRLPYGILLNRESLRNVHNELTHNLGQNGIKWFLYTIRAYARSDDPLRVHVTHRGDSSTSIQGQEPHPQYGAPLKPRPDNDNYTYKIIDPNLEHDQYDPTEITHYRDDTNE